MLKCASLYTYEIDDPETALGEINAQLAEKIELMENTVGIIMCNTEFIKTGVLKFICDNLPFDLVGVTTSSQAVNDALGELILTVFVMTSGDIRFRAGITKCLDNEIDAPLKEAFLKASKGLSDPPGLALIFPPLILKYAGDSYVNACAQIIPDVPVFGTIAIDDTVSFDESETIYNGDTYETAMPFVLCYGNINPRFIIGTLPEGNNMPYRGEITKSNGPFVSEINDMNAYKYFEDLGLAKDGSPLESLTFVPFMIDQRKRVDYDGIPVMRGIVSFTDDGTAIFRGNVDENSIFTLMNCTPEDVLSTTRKKLGEIGALFDVNGILLFPCIVRRLVIFGTDPLDELQSARDIINPDIPFMMGYAGGEICPTSMRNGVPANRFHNYSLVILIV